MLRLTGAILFAALILCAPPSLARNCSGDMLGVAQRLPHDVDLLVVVQRAGEHRASEAGPALDALVRAVFSEGDTFQMWSALAAQLRVCEKDAFDALLGRRVAIAVRGLWTDEPRWALLSEVDNDTERRLRRRLPVSPRQIVAGRTVFSVEKGRYELIIERGDDCNVILVAPAAGASLFEEIAPTLDQRQRRPLAATPAFRELLAQRIGIDAPHDGRDVFVYMRIPEDDGGWIGGFLKRDGLAINASMMIRPSELPPAIEPWRIHDWRALSRGSVLCVLERRPNLRTEVKGVSPSVFSNMPWLAPDEQFERTLADRHAVIVHRADGGGFSVTAGVEMSDVAAGALHGDNMMRSMIIGVSRIVGAGAWSYDFKGLFPEATRAVSIIEEGGVDLPLIGGESLEFAWTYRADRAGDGKRGWMIGGVDRGIVERTADAIAAEPQRPGLERTGAWLSLGLVRPGEILEAVRETGVPIPAPAEALRWISYFGWQAEIEAGADNAADNRGHIKGFARIRLAGDKEESDP